MENDNHQSPNPDNHQGSSIPTGTKRRRRDKPRRDGKGSNNQAKTADNQTGNQQPIGELADEAAIAEGGIKTIGNQRLLPFMKAGKPMVIVSAILVIISVLAIIINGLNLGLDFTGGVSADVQYQQPVEQSEVISHLEQNGFTDAVVQYLGTRQELLIRLPPQSDSVDGLNAALNNALDLPNNDANISNINIIGSQVGSEIYVNSLLALALALGSMLVYVAIRFQFKLAVGAVLALFHDTIITLGIFAIFGWPFDLTVLAAVLALIGYSLNDTIVVYDRIRENFRRVRGISASQIIDLSLTETLRRTIMTVGTVLLVVLAMMFLGGASLFWFSVALLIGLIAGTYSSIYIASAIPLMMGLSRDDFVVKIKPEFEEEVVTFNDPKMSN